MTAPSTAAAMAPIAVLRRESRGRGSGIVTVTAGKLRRLFCLDNGRLVFAASNLIEEQLEEVLAERGLVAPSDATRLKVEATRAGKKLALHLVDEELLSRAEAERVVGEHCRALLFASLELRDATATFAEGKANLAGELTVSTPLGALLIEHARRYPETVQKVRVAIGPPTLRPKLTAEAEKLLDGIALDDVARDLLQRCDGKRDLTALIAESDTDAEPILRAVLGLLQAGVLEGARQAAAAASSDEAVGRDEALARMGAADGADHYGVLGVDRRAPKEEIRRAYYNLARRYHPDRFRAGELRDLLLQIENFFAGVTEAYNTLIDEERRKSYDEELAERVGKAEQPEQDSSYLARQNYARARSLLGRNRNQEAAKFLRNAIQLDATRGEYFRELGRILGTIPRHRAEAEEHLRKAVELSPADPYSHLELGLVLERAGRPDEAIAAVREALNWDDGNAEAIEALRRLGG